MKKIGDFVRRIGRRNFLILCFIPFGGFFFYHDGLPGLLAAIFGWWLGGIIYEWKDSKAVKLPSPVQPTEEMIDRLILPMSNVCVACLREGIVENGDVVDGAMIFGTGYAPFRGGPLNYARTRGTADVVAALKMLEAKFGERFKPDAGWDTFA